MSNEDLKKEEKAPESGEVAETIQNNDENNCGTDFNTFLGTFVKKLESQYEIGFAFYELDESNEPKITLSHKNAADIINLLREARSAKELKTDGNDINENCIAFTNKMLWFLNDMLIGMNVALYRRSVMQNNNVDIEMNATDILKQNNAFDYTEDNYKQSDNGGNNKETRVSMVVYLAMNYMNNCWHSYFKKDGNIWCIEECVDTFIKHSGLLNVKCSFFHTWTLFEMFNGLFLDKLFNDQYPCVKITNADELRAFCMLVIGAESEEILRKKVQYVWSQLKCEKECAGNEEYDGTDYFQFQSMQK